MRWIGRFGLNRSPTSRYPASTASRSSCRQRLADIQAEFIEEPRAAVQKAERLIEEAVDHMAKSMHEHVKRMHGDMENNADTERLRLVMRSYRDFIDSLDSRRTA